MKASSLIVGQKYDWKRNREVTQEVEYIGLDYCGSVLIYVFKYYQSGSKYYTELPAIHCARDIN